MHEAKPLVCAIFPLGRGFGGGELGLEADGKIIIPNPEDVKPIYFNGGAPCGSRSQTNTVRAWLERFGIPADDVFYAHWTHTTIFLMACFRRVEKHIPESALQLLWGAVFQDLYENYDTEKDLMEQFLANSGRLKSLLTEMERSLNAGGVGDGE